ncbi:MAG: hypothetical protein V1784_11685, partial [bacterium]
NWGCGDPVVGFVDIATGRTFNTVRFPDDVIESIHIVSGGKTAIFCSVNGRVYFYDIDRQALMLTLVVRPEQWVCFTPDGRYDASGDAAHVTLFGSSNKVYSIAKARRIPSLMTKVIGRAGSQ